MTKNQKKYVRTMRFAGMFSVFLIMLQNLLANAVADYGFLLIHPTR